MSDNVVKDAKEQFKKDLEEINKSPENERIFKAYMLGVLFYSNRVKNADVIMR